MALTPETFQNLERDIDDTGKAINTIAVISPRYGEPFYSLPLAVQKVMETGGFEPFTTEAALLASTPTISPKAAKALDTKKIWYWGKEDGETTESWHDTGLSELDQAKSYFDSFFKTGINIFDKSVVEHDMYYNWSNGKKGPSVGFVAGLYPIKPATEYQVPPEYTQQMAFFTNDMKYISGLASVPAHKFTTPDNAAFVGITVENANIDIMMICKSSEYPNKYVPFKLYLTKLGVMISQIDGFEEAINGVLGPFEPFYYDIVTGAKVRAGWYVDQGTGQQGPSPTYNVVGPCVVKPDTLYRTSADYNQQFAFFDANDVYVDGELAPTPSKTFTSPTNAKYVRFTVSDSQLAGFMVSEASDFDSAAQAKLLGMRKLGVKSSQIIDLDQFVDDKLGLVAINLIDLSPSKIIQNKYVDYKTGALADNADFVAAGPYLIAPETEYQLSTFYGQQFAFYTESGVYIDGLARPTNNKFTSPVNAKYIRLSVPKSQINQLVLAKSDNFPSEYVPHEIALAENLRVPSLGNGIKTTDIWVSADENETDPKVKFRGKNAIQLAIDSITDATATNRYAVRDVGTTFKVDKASDFIGYLGYPSMILMKDHVDVIGQGRDKTIIYAELPYNDADIGPSADGSVYPRLQYQTVYNYANDSVMKDLTCIAKNLRYTIHIDNPNGANKERKFDNVSFVFKGDKGGLTAMGCGTSSGERTIIVGGQSFSDKNVPFASHNNSDFDKPSYWSFTSHNFVALANVNFAYMQNDGSLLEDQLELVGCSFGGKAYQLGYVDVWLTGNTATNKDSFNHAEWQITGYGNDPFLFKNDAGGKSLRFTTTAKGTTASIRFDKNSSAYSILIKNNQNKSSGAVLHNGREYLDGYIVQDGSVDLPAQAWACRDIYEGVYLYDEGVNYTRLGVRLGDCSVNNKTLGVIVNGTLNTIVFNKNYGPMMNSEIIAEMNSQLNGAVIDAVSYGREYYPTVTDVCEPAYNITSTFIPKGSLVAKSGGYVRLASGTDKVYGVALDDIPVMQTTSEGVAKGQGRVLKRGYISASRSEAFYVLADNQNPAIRTKFSVNNGQLVTDSNGKVSVDIDTGIISINC
ncbi:hypothetical protein [Acinetobacter nosocomialis]|uniref:hypothetical protein n=1 Tax=Acinetobacter nosocomialis TaxID=106654 RepID=UPI00201297F0|nr:hypothetical protein [Acinetobacter nosocomialis]